jgi:hypothetical protein
MESLAELDALFDDVSLADEASNRWYVRPIPSLGDSRLLLSRGADQEYCLFLKGPLASFGRLPFLPCLEFRQEAVDADSGETFPALKITAPRFTQGNAAVAHVLYELIRLMTEDPSIDNNSLLSRVSWILQILGSQNGPMSDTKQRGLVAELILLLELLRQVRHRGLSPDRVIDKWVDGRRDFVGNGVAIEVKSTASVTRRHHISSIDQLDVDPDVETVFLYSVGLRHDPGTQKRLPDYVGAVEAELVQDGGEPLLDARETFESKLASHGYEPKHGGLYASGDGIRQSPSLPPRLFNVEELERMTIDDFKNGELPTGVVSVSYELEISSEPISISGKTKIFDTMIGN